jgi:RNA polymerase sigma-70 factor, ECF subfamily
MLPARAPWGGGQEALAANTPCRLGSTPPMASRRGSPPLEHPPPARDVAGADPDATLLAGMRAGDEQAFATIVMRYHASLKRVARMYVSTDAVADEVVQETWLAVIAGLDRFEGRSTLKTWIFHILTNKAKTRGVREHRTVPFASLAPAGEDAPTVAPDRFRRADDPFPGHWATPPRPWEDPERRLGSLEARERLREAIAALPPVQQAVLTLRDVEGVDADEVCRLLDVSAGNQRVILHRARARVREALAGYMETE